MTRDWENTLSCWARPPGEAEEQRSKNAIRARLVNILERPAGEHFATFQRPLESASCPKTQTNSRLARRAVSIVITPWRAPDQGRVGGDVGDSGSPHAQGKHRPATGC